MKRFNLVAAAIGIAVALSGPVRADEPQRQITVTGDGRVATEPDMATITLGVTNQAEDAGTAMAATSRAVARMLSRLDALGIAPRDIQTRNLSLGPVWSNRGSSSSQPPRITGFVASNTVLVRVRDLDALGTVMDGVIADGANDFNGLRFSVQEPDPLIDEARRRAVADAVAKADLLASAAGVTLGPVMSISDQGGGRPVPMEMAAARASDMPIAAGEVTVSATVSIVFALGD